MNSCKMYRVAILDGQTVQALPVVQSLKKQGYYVILFCETKTSYGYHTRFADEKIVVPSTKKDTKEFHEQFIAYLKHSPVDVVLPMNDNSAHYMSLYKSVLLEYCRLFIPDYGTFMNGYDKNRLMTLCREKGFPHPVTSDLSQNSVEEAAERVGFPSLIKPNITTGARGFAIVHSTGELRQKLIEIEKVYGHCHLQEFIPSGGRQFKVQLFIQEQKLVNATIVHKIRYYPEKGGSSCFLQSVENKELTHLCFDVLRTLQWEGFADFDLIEDPRNGTVKIMEINPRIPACIKASFTAGVDFAENIVDASLGKPARTHRYNPGGYLRYLGFDILWLIKSKKPFKTEPSWFQTLFRSDHYLQDGSMSDPKPFLFGTWSGIRKQLDPDLRKEKEEME